MITRLLLRSELDYTSMKMKRMGGGHKPISNGLLDRSTQGSLLPLLAVVVITRSLLFSLAKKQRTVTGRMVIKWSIMQCIMVAIEQISSYRIGK